MAALAPPRDLTIPDAGSTTSRSIFSLALGALLRSLAGIAPFAPPSARGEAASIEKLVRATPPGALASSLRRPAVSGLARCVGREEVPDPDALFVELLAELAFDLAILGALPHPVSLRRWPARLLAPHAQLAVTLPADAGAVTLDNGRVTVGAETVDLRDPAPTGLAARPYHVVTGDVVLATVDNNPVSHLEAHPEKSGNAVDLGERPPSAWTAALADAIDLIARYMPDARREMDLYAAQIVPVGWDAERHFSASYQTMIGAIYMSLHPNRMTLTEAILHEMSHNKLNALLAVDRVIENAWRPLYASPVRPDPRPLHGVLLAVHAFLPVARLYETMIAEGDAAAQRDDFRARYAAIRRVNREGAELVLREARPTPVGAGLLAEIRRWHEHYLEVDARA